VVRYQEHIAMNALPSSPRRRLIWDIKGEALG